MNDETFKVGEIGILQNLKGAVEKFNGNEVTVIGALDQRKVLTLQGTVEFLVTYIVDFQDMPMAVRPSNLKKKRPPSVIDSILRELEVA